MHPPSFLARNVASVLRLSEKRSVVLAAAAWCFAVAGAVVVVGLFAPPFTFNVEGDQIAPEVGLAHVWMVPDVGWIYQLRGDSESSPAGSTLQVFEDGVALGPAHTLHDQIRTLGQGRFSHWTISVRFSASDNSDPSRNGRHYTVRAASTLSTYVGALGIAAFVAGVALIGLWARAGASASSRIRLGLAAVHQCAFVPAVLNSRWTVILLLVGGIAGVAGVILGWVAGSAAQIGLELGRFFPLSDAMAYHSCGISLAAWGHFDSFASLCARRILYPSMLASIFRLGGWSAQNALIVQGLLIGLAATSLALQIARVTSGIAGVAAGVMLLVFVWEYTLGVFMTEVAGFVMGALGLCLLLAFSESKRAPWLFLGVAFLSTALISRAGALFVVPAVLAWVVIAFRHDDRLPKFLLVGIVAAAVGPALQFAGMWALGLDTGNTAGNLSTLLYGLSTGSNNWTEAYERFREVFETKSESEFFATVYSAAFQNIRDRPVVFIQSLAAMFSAYCRGFFDIGVLEEWRLLLRTLFVAGVAHAAMRWRRSAAGSLLVVLCLAEAAAAPFTGNLGSRVFAASVAIRLAICALGLQALLDLMARGLRAAGSLPKTAAADVALPMFASAAGLSVMAMMLLPFVPLSGQPRLQSVAPTGRCPAGLDEVISRIGQEAIMIGIVSHAEPAQLSVPVRISHERLLDARYRDKWYASDIARLQPPVTIMHAVDRSTGRRGSIRFVAYQGVLDETNEPQILCVDSSRAVQMAAASYSLIREVLPRRP